MKIFALATATTPMDWRAILILVQCYISIFSFFGSETEPV